MTAAARKAAISTVDKAVADGDMTKAAGDRLKARIDAAPADGCAVLAGLRAKAAKAVAVVKDGVTAAADALKMTPAELRAELRGGKSLKDVATAQNVSYATVSAAIVAAVKTDLDAAVKAGPQAGPRRPDPRAPRGATGRRAAAPGPPGRVTDRGRLTARGRRGPVVESGRPGPPGPHSPARPARAAGCGPVRCARGPAAFRQLVMGGALGAVEPPFWVDRTPRCMTMHRPRVASTRDASRCRQPGQIARET